MISFIKTTVKDLETIETLARKIWPDTFGAVMPAEQIQYMLDKIYNKTALIQQLEQGHNFVLIQHQNNTVGYTSYELNYKAEPKLMIHKIYLLPSAQGQGIGKQSFDYLTAIAVRHEQQALTLKVFHKNESAIAFYLKKGFENIGTETTDIGGGYSIIDYVMSKELK